MSEFEKKIQAAIQEKKKPTTKTCTKCGLDKPFDEFSRDGTCKNGEPKYHAQCKICMSNNYVRCHNCGKRKAEPEMLYYVRVDLPSKKFEGLGLYMCDQECADWKWGIKRIKEAPQLDV